MRRFLLRFTALGYLLLVLLGALAMVFVRAFDQGAGALWRTLSDPNTVHAFELTTVIAGITVPLNTVFGVVCALAIVRRRFPGAGLVNALVDLPLAISPVVVGLSLFLLYGRTGWFGPWFERHGTQILFALPSMVIATIFVSLPFVAREVVPTLREIGDEQEQAARTLGASGWQTFWRITLPSIRWAVVSGNLEGKTQTVTLRVQDAYENFNQAGAYGVALVLAAMSVVVLVAMTLVKPREESV